MVFNRNNKVFINRQPFLLFGLLLFIISSFSCNNNNNAGKPLSKVSYDYLLPVDSINFDYTTGSKLSSNTEYSEDFYGQNRVWLKDGSFLYASINSRKELHVFDFKTNKHQYSKQICPYSIKAYRVDSGAIYLIYNGFFYKKNFQLKTLDSFRYPAPSISKPHGIDYDKENNANLFKVGDYFALMYYIIDKAKDGSDSYRHTNYLFYYFNKDTSFFADKGCLDKNPSFEYFRYPALTSDGGYIYHAPRVKNCLAKSNYLKTLFTKPIDSSKNNYLTLQPNDQYLVSKVKRFRFSTDYNRDLLVTPNSLFLLKGFPKRIYKKKGITKYERNLELIEFDKQLNVKNHFYIRDTKYTFVFINGRNLFLFNFEKGKYYVYKI